MDEKQKEVKYFLLKDKLYTINKMLKSSCLQKIDRTDYLILLINMIKEILKKDSIEEYFDNNQQLITFFIGDFLEEILDNIVSNTKISGKNGDELAIELFFNIIKLFLKFHGNKYCLSLLKNIFIIFNYEKNILFLNSSKDYITFNSIYNSEYLRKKTFKIGDEVDIGIENKHSITKFDEIYWVRGKIKDIVNDEYIVEDYERDDYINFSINDYGKLYESGEKTVDWDWRNNLKKMI